MEAGWLPRCHAWQGGWQDGWRQFFFAQLVASLGREEGEEAEEEGGAIEQPAEARPPRSGLLPPLLPPSPLEEWRVCVMVCVCVCECELPLLSSSRPVVVCCAGWGLFGRVPALLSSCLFAFAVLSWSPRRSLCTVACTPTMLQALSGGMVAVLLSHHDPVSIWSDWSLSSPSLSLGSLDVAIACLTISW